MASNVLRWLVLARQPMQNTPAMTEAVGNVVWPGRRGGAWTFGLLFLLESLARAFNAGVLSIQAYDILGAAQKVSLLATLTASSVLVITLFMPLVFGRLRRRHAYMGGALLIIAGSVALATFTLEGQIAGAIMRNVGQSLCNVTMQLYIMDHIRKEDLTRSEPVRLATSTLAWVICPASGVFLYQHFGPIAPQIAATVMALTLLAVFWYLRLHDPEVLPRGTLQPFNPLANVKRFVLQPRLRLAWLIAFARSCFWTALFTYGPLLMIEGGIGKGAGGLLISLSQVCLLWSFIYGWAAKRWGVRAVITACFVAVSVASLVGGLFGTASPWIAGGVLLLGAVAASGVDAVGAIPYLRAVKFHDRQRMTAVYRTYLELSDLIPSMVYAVALHFTDVSVVFILMGVFASVVSVLSWRFIPRAM